MRVIRDPADLSLSEAARAIRAGSLAPVELVQACLERIERLDRSIRAFVALDFEGALRAAGYLADELVSSEPRSPLHGIPVGVKDIIDVKGFQTQAGSHVLDDNPPVAADAPAVRSLREAGAVVLGKTTTHEFGYGVVTPPTRNPWDTSRIPGGSSGGSGAAVAAGECLGALGTDSGGSVRVPSALCGITGLRPRPGIVPIEGVVPFSWTHDTCGPMARSAADVTAMWNILSASEVVGVGRLQGLRVGVVPIPDALEVDPEVQNAFRAAVETIAEGGAQIATVDIPAFREWDAPRAALVLCEFLAAHRHCGWYPDRAHLYSEELLAYLRKAEQIGGADVVLARRALGRLADRFLGAFEDTNLLVLPTAVMIAPRVDEIELDQGEDALPLPINTQLIRSCGLISWCRLAAASVPCGFSREGLPIGLQLVGRTEEAVLTAAIAYQSLTDHHERRPGQSSVVAGQDG